MANALEGTAALVTGASSGIGEAPPAASRGRGAAVALAARRKDRLDALMTGDIVCMHNGMREPSRGTRSQAATVPELMA